MSELPVALFTHQMFLMEEKLLRQFNSTTKDSFQIHSWMSLKYSTGDHPCALNIAPCSQCLKARLAPCFSLGVHSQAFGYQKLDHLLLVHLMAASS